jgi:thymidylate kinase
MHRIKNIETYGLCGAGKSTILNKLISVFRSRCPEYLAIERPVEPSLVATLYQAGPIIMKAIRREPAATVKFLAAYQSWWLPLKLAYRLAGMNMRGDDEARLLIDSGILQPFVSFEIERNVSMKKIPIDALLNTLPLPDLIIYIRVSAETAFNRYISRGRINGKKKLRETLRGRFQKGMLICESIRQRLEKFRTPLMILNAEEEISSIDLEKFATRIINEYINASGE